MKKMIGFVLFGVPIVLMLASCRKMTYMNGARMQTSKVNDEDVMEGVGCDSKYYQKMNVWIQSGSSCDGNIYHYIDVVVGCGLKKDSLAIVVRKAMALNCSMDKSSSVSWFLRDDNANSLADSFDARFSIQSTKPKNH